MNTAHDAFSVISTPSNMNFCSCQEINMHMTIFMNTKKVWLYIHCIYNTTHIITYTHILLLCLLDGGYLLGHHRQHFYVNTIELIKACPGSSTGTYIDKQYVYMHTRIIRMYSVCMYMYIQISFTYSNKKVLKIKHYGNNQVS